MELISLTPTLKPANDYIWTPQMKLSDALISRRVNNIAVAIIVTFVKSALLFATVPLDIVKYSVDLTFGNAVTSVKNIKISLENRRHKKEFANRTSTKVKQHIWNNKEKYLVGLATIPAAIYGGYKFFHTSNITGK